MWENLSLAGQINAGTQNYETACHYYEQAMHALKERRDQLSIDDYKIALAGDSSIQEIYFGATRSAIEWHLFLHKTRTTGGLNTQLQRAFVNLERGKARSLLDLIGGSAFFNKSSPPQSHNPNPSSRWPSSQHAVLCSRTHTYRRTRPTLRPWSSSKPTLPRESNSFGQLQRVCHRAGNLGACH